MSSDMYPLILEEIPAGKIWLCVSSLIKAAEEAMRNRSHAVSRQTVPIIIEPAGYLQDNVLIKYLPS